ncbi:endonuclease [Aquimarina sp. ERC-38]|uniref:endonuclease/exonuclease/phosphatase family protein n=1 Tax=Aquimarina sp. ERC-38 TaxID=2949996 RepID=UPI002247C5DA|nr:endonuclease [Aquimarina sp. ERC-38]UZO81811.1 endonuclease [Aquimarina sp. ERC-38]
MNNRFARRQPSSITTIAFYNLENLFDTIDDPHTLDENFLPNSDREWNLKKYESKLFKLATVIPKIGVASAGTSPVLVGVAEVENKKVLKDLVAVKSLKKEKYKFIHYNSPDERGIDVALLYQPKHFEVLSSEPISVYVEDEPEVRDYTRDILYVTGNLHNEKVHILVNHWPSRRDGSASTQHKRIAAAIKNREVITNIRETELEAKIIIMGDFNDDPKDQSVREHLVQDDFYNPMEKIHSRYRGSLSYRKNWNHFDQIIISNNFHRFEKNKLSFAKADVFDADFLKVYEGRYKGVPFRTYVGDDWQGGYSDHFPVYVQLKLN